MSFEPLGRQCDSSLSAKVLQFRDAVAPVRKFSAGDLAISGDTKVRLAVNLDADDGTVHNIVAVVLHLERVGSPSLVETLLRATFFHDGLFSFFMGVPNPSVSERNDYTFRREVRLSTTSLDPLPCLPPSASVVIPVPLRPRLRPRLQPKRLCTSDLSRTASPCPPSAIVPLHHPLSPRTRPCSRLHHLLVPRTRPCSRLHHPLLPWT